MSRHKYNEAYDKGYEDGKKAAFNDWIFMNYDELSRKEQIELLMNEYGADFSGIERRLKEMPEREKGSWKYESKTPTYVISTENVTCRVCFRKRSRMHGDILNYCPNCGADMRTDKEMQFFCP